MRSTWSAARACWATPTRRTPRASSGIKLFARLLSLLTWSKVTDPACGYRAVRTSSLRGLEFRQDQFHNSEFIVEASKKHLRTMEAPVTVTNRLSGQSKKPPHFRYGMGFANALMRAWLR